MNDVEEWSSKSSKHNWGFEIDKLFCYTVHPSKSAITLCNRSRNLPHKPCPIQSRDQNLHPTVQSCSSVSASPPVRAFQIEHEIKVELPHLVLEIHVPSQWSEQGLDRTLVALLASNKNPAIFLRNRYNVEELEFEFLACPVNGCGSFVQPKLSDCSRKRDAENGRLWLCDRNKCGIPNLVNVKITLN